MNKKISVGLAIAIAIIAATVAFSITMILSMKLYDTTIASVQEKETMYNKLSELDKYVRANTVEDINDETLNDTIASGYVLGTGDRYATYYTAKAYSDLLDVQSGALMGIGVDIVKDASGYAKVIRVYAESPAEEVGLQKGDFITTIDGTDVKTLNTRESILSKLRGTDGSTAEISYLNAANESQDISIQRSAYTVPTVEYQMVGDNCGYIKILNFTDATAAELDYAMNQTTGSGALCFVFDLRGNTSTNLSAAADALDLICSSGAIGYSANKAGDLTSLGSFNQETSVSTPIACLVNESTACAAELFAADLQESSKAQLVGVATAGKAVVLSEPQKMTDGSAVVLTVANLLTANQNSFADTGLTVDVEIALSSNEQQNYYDLTPDTDSQIKRAVEVARSLAGVTGVATTQAPADAAQAQPAA